MARLSVTLEDGMAQALKIMTWNVEQLPPPIKWNAKSRARKACDLILRLPAREQPDVITLNEVFIQSARSIFVQRLKTRYPHYHRKIGEHTYLQDSGLMVFSKYPFHTLSNGLKIYFKSYDDAEDEDQLANKGIAVVKIDGPRGPTVVSLTHMQSGPNRRAVRKKQFRQINNALRLNANSAVLRVNTVLTGDLNVYGHLNGAASEVREVFSDLPNTFGNLCHDGWPAIAIPPTDTAVHDIGYTQENENGALRRLDYMCLPRAHAGHAGLAAHHVWIAFRPDRSIADHWAVMGMLHHEAPHCMPSSAFDIRAQTPAATAPGGKKLWTGTATITDEGMYWWVYVSAPGTYAVFTHADLNAAAFARNALSKPIVPGAAVTAAQLPAAFAAALAPFGAGQTFTSTVPFFMRLRGSTAAFTGAAVIAVAEVP
jgi:exonuclease III